MINNTSHNKINSESKNINSSFDGNYFFYEKLPYEQPKLLSFYDKLPFKLKVNREGLVILFDLEGNRLTSKEADKRKKEFSIEILRFLQDSCYEINSRNSSIEKFYILAPRPTPFKRYRKRDFLKARPEFPCLENPFFLKKIIFKKKAKAIEELNEKKIYNYTQKLKEWKKEKEDFLIQENKIELKWNKLLWEDPLIMKETFLRNLLKNRFPLSLSFKMIIKEEGKEIIFELIILDKNEIIKREAFFDKQEKKIKFKKFLEKEEKETRDKNIISLLFFFASEIFYSLPKSQIIDIKSSHEEEILLNFKIDRQNWKELYSLNNIEDFALESLIEKFK